MTYKDSQQLVRFLALAEEQQSEQELVEFLFDQQELDPRNFRVRMISVPEEGKERPVVIGGHTIQRGMQRIKCPDADTLYAFIMKAVQHEKVRPELSKYIIVLNEDGTPISLSEDGIDSIIIVDDKHGVTYCVETGFTWILVKTVWNNWSGSEFRTNARNKVIHI